MFPSLQTSTLAKRLLQKERNVAKNETLGRRGGFCLKLQLDQVVKWENFVDCSPGCGLIYSIEMVEDLWGLGFWDQMHLNTEVKIVAPVILIAVNPKTCVCRGTICHVC